MPSHALLARASAAAVVLDPVENISADSVGKRSEYWSGMYRQQYRAAARDGIWGTEHSGRCGLRCLVSIRADELRLLPMLCDTWACPLCGPRKAAWLMRQIRQSLQRDGLHQFWTLTVSTDSCTPEESTTKIKSWWNNLHRRLDREYGKFSFLWTMEFTKRGYAHLHLLTSLQLTQGALSAQWKEVTQSSYIVDAESVDSDAAARYLAKYCTQQARLRAEPGYQHLKGKRFFSKSRDVHFEPFRSKTPPADDGQAAATWQVWDRPYWVAMQRLKESGAELRQAQMHGVPKATWTGVDTALVGGLYETVTDPALLLPGC